MDKTTELYTILNCGSDMNKAMQIADEIISDNGKDAGAVCGTMAWKFIELRDYNNAFCYAAKGSELSDTNSYRVLADLYYDGNAVSQDYSKAYEYLLKAVAAGDDVPSHTVNLYKNQAESVSKGKRQGCYIATCVYGTYDCPQVWTLRRYRDMVLSKNWCGRMFIKLYYAISPIIVRVLGKSKCIRTVWKRLLDKKVKSLNNAGIYGETYYDRV